MNAVPWVLPQDWCCQANHIPQPLPPGETPLAGDEGLLRNSGDLGPLFLKRSQHFLFFTRHLYPRLLKVSIIYSYFKWLRL